METYKNWVTKNRDFVHSLESLANGMTWLLPERFSASEIGPEAVTAFVGVITAINQHIIDAAAGTARKGMSIVEQSFPWSLCISMIKDLETLVEVAAQHFYGDDKKWNVIAIMEASKVLIRLALFHDGGYKMILHGGEVPNVVKSQNSPESKMGHFPRPGGYPGANGHLQDFHSHDLRNPEGRALFALTRFGENAKMASDPTWLNRIQHLHAQFDGHPDLATKKPTLASIWSEKGISGGLFVLGEILYILRPLIYVLSIRKYGVHSWIPWTLSLTVDVTGMGILLHVRNAGCISRENSFPLSPAEEDEIKRRKLLWALYLMRDPFFSHHTRHHLEHVEKLSGPVPLIGFLSAKLVELLIGAQTRYTYTSAS